jgi:hypothetical protein
MGETNQNMGEKLSGYNYNSSIADSIHIFWSKNQVSINRGRWIVNEMADIFIIIIIILILLFTAIGFVPGGSSPNLVQTKTMKQHYTIIKTQYNNTYKMQ